MARGQNQEKPAEILYGQQPRGEKDPADVDHGCPIGADMPAPIFDTVANTYTDSSGATYRNIHPHTSDCDLYGCSIHSPSDHPMIDWPTVFRSDTGMMERICSHGVGHPDPDALNYLVRSGQAGARWAGVHGCDGCCS